MRLILTSMKTFPQHGEHAYDPCKICIERYQEKEYNIKNYSISNTFDMIKIKLVVLGL